MDTTPSSFNLRLAQLEVYQEICISSNGEHSSSFLTMLEAAMRQAGSDAMAVLPLFQHGSWAPALIRRLEKWLLSMYIGRKEIHSQACKWLDNDKCIFLLWLLGFSDCSFSKAVQLKIFALPPCFYLAQSLLKRTAVAQMQLGGWERNWVSTCVSAANTHLLASRYTQLILRGRGMTLAFSSRQYMQHPADGTRGEAFPIGSREAALGGGDGARRWSSTQHWGSCLPAALRTDCNHLQWLAGYGDFLGH